MEDVSDFFYKSNGDTPSRTIESGWFSVDPNSPSTYAVTVNDAVIVPTAVPFAPSIS